MTSIFITQEWVDAQTWPYTGLTNGTTNTTVTFLENIIFTNSTQYFNIVNKSTTGNTLVINGNGHTITIQNITGYPAVFNTPNTQTESIGYSFTLTELGVISDNSALATGGGWICGSRFLNGPLFGSRLCSIQYCYSIGDISEGSGGIVGELFAGSNVSVLNNCYNVSNTISTNGGGIIGNACGGAADFPGSFVNLNMSNCIAVTTTIATEAGGLLGRNPGYPKDGATHGFNIANNYLVYSTNSNDPSSDYFPYTLYVDQFKRPSLSGNQNSVGAWSDSTAQLAIPNPTSFPFTTGVLTPPLSTSTIWLLFNNNAQWKLYWEEDPSIGFQVISKDFNDLFTKNKETNYGKVNTFDNIKTNSLTVTGESAVVPIYGIILWGSTSGSIPNNFKLCNGSSYGSITTPDLSSSAPGSTFYIMRIY